MSEAVGFGGVSLETITIAASRSGTLSLSEMELLVASAVVVGLVVWMLIARLRRDRQSTAGYPAAQD